MAEKIAIGFVLLLSSIVLAVLASFILALPVWLLWNSVMPEVFELSRLTIGQAWGLSLLTGLLFKSSSTSSSKKD